MKRTFLAYCERHPKICHAAVVAARGVRWLPRLAFQTSVVMGGIALVLIGAWSVDRRVPIEIIDRAEIAGGGTRPNETIVVDTVVQVHQTCLARVTRSFRDARGVLHPLEGYDLALRKGPPQALQIAVPIPAAASPGLGRYRSRYTAACNPVQAIVWPLSDDLADVAVTVTAP